MNNIVKPRRTKAKFVTRKTPPTDKGCVGMFLASFNRAFMGVIKESEPTEVELYAAAKVMDATFRAVARDFCRCTWCKMALEKIEEYYKDKQQEADCQK